MYRKDCFAKLLYLIHDGVDQRAAVVWSNSEVLDAMRQVVLVLDPEHRAVLEVTRYARGNVFSWRHSASSGTPTGGVHLMYAKSLPSTLLHLPDRTSPDARLIDRAKELVPNLFG
ncbi:MAG TPA: hypothetical protein VNA27_17495 [Rubrobacteraceae bacterium]|nr:hypothetical protein [Rubrobacteraceae bacterium]